jgi:hypothetical protein
MAITTNPEVFAGSNRFTRKWGTRAGNVAEPYISGYHFIHWSYLPEIVVKGQSNLTGVDSVVTNTNVDQVGNILSSLCLSVTIPGRTVNPVEMQGLGGLKWRAIGNIDEGNDLSMRFLELQELPIHRIFHGWTKGIRDNRSGTTYLQGKAPREAYKKSNYAGTVYYWTTLPNGYDLEFAACYAGVFPLKDPSDSFSHDVAANDKLEIDMDFSTDYSYQEGWVYKRCENFVDTYSKRGWNQRVASPGAPSGSVIGYAQEEFQGA